MRATPALIALALASAAPAVAQTPAPNAAAVIKARQAGYKDIGKASKGVRDELTSAAPSVPSIQAYAKTIAGYGPQVGTWFPRGTGPDSGLKTSAKAEIWSKPQDFAKAADAFRVQSAAFYAVAQKGDVNAIRAAYPDLGATCRNCHEEFRLRDEH